DQAGLANTGVSDNRDDLSVTVAGLAGCFSKLLELGISTDETCQTAPCGGGLKTSSRPCRTRELVHFHRLGEPFYLNSPKRLHGDVVASERNRGWCKDHRARLGDLLHATREVRRVADSGVVEAKITAKSSHHDLTRVHSNSDLY